MSSNNNFVATKDVQHPFARHITIPDGFSQRLLLPTDVTSGTYQIDDETPVAISPLTGVILDPGQSGPNWPHGPGKPANFLHTIPGAEFDTVTPSGQTVKVMYELKSGTAVITRFHFEGVVIQSQGMAGCSC